jgi:hypothetical protein
MKTQWMFGLLVILLVVLTAAPFAQEASKEEMQAAAQEAWMKAAQPGEHHQHLADLVGSWEYISKMWVDPAAPPTESTGSCERTMILDGRYLHEDFTGNFMGMPFKGIGITGYNNVEEKYTAIWMDNSSTTLMAGAGTCSDEGKTLKVEMEYMDVMTKQTAIMRFVARLVEPNKQHIEYYGTGPDGKEFKMMEFVYTRK